MSDDATNQKCVSVKTFYELYLMKNLQEENTLFKESLKDIWFLHESAKVKSSQVYLHGFKLRCVRAVLIRQQQGIETLRT